MAEKNPQESEAYKELIRRALASLSDFGGAAKESATGMAQGMADMFNASRGDIPTAAKGGVGLIEGGKEFADASPGKRAVMTGELVSGLPLRQIGGDVGKGNYAKAFGHATPGILAAMTAIKGAKLARPTSVASRLAIPEAAALDSRISGLPPVESVSAPTFKSPLPAYEHVLEQQFGPNAPKPTATKAPFIDIRERFKPVIPKNPLADGTLPKHADVIPEFRSKSGMAVDVLDEMKKTPLLDYTQPDGPSVLDEFTAHHTGTHPMLTRRVGSAVSDMRPDGSMPKHADEVVWSRLNEDPVGYVAQLRGQDENALSMRDPVQRRKAIDLADEYGLGPDVVAKGPEKIDQLTQELSNYFTSPEYDPSDPTPPSISDLYNFGNDVTMGETRSLIPYLKRIGMDWDKFQELPPTLQKHVVESFRASQKGK